MTNHTAALQQHTPRQWVDDNARDYSTRRVIRRNGVIVATISEPTAGLGVDEVEANARLIAAAPDLLEALRAIAAEDYRGNKPNAVSIAEAAIAKATHG